MPRREEKENSIHQMKAERTENKLKLRKKLLNETISSKKFPPSLLKEAPIETHPPIRAPEAIEDTKNGKEEPSEPIGLINLSNIKKKTRKTKRKCWICKSPNHFKKNCPKIKCSHCHKLGHMKEHCYKSKVYFIFN